MKRHSREMVRHHAERVKAHVRSSYYNANAWDREWQTPRIVGKTARTKHPCSCMGCGHARYWEGPTVQERRLDPVPAPVDAAEEYWEQEWEDRFPEDFSHRAWWWFEQPA